MWKDDQSPSQMALYEINQLIYDKPSYQYDCNNRKFFWKIVISQEESDNRYQADHPGLDVLLESLVNHNPKDDQ